MVAWTGAGLGAFGSCSLQAPAVQAVRRPKAMPVAVQYATEEGGIGTNSLGGADCKYPLFMFFDGVQPPFANHLILRMK